MNIAKPGIPLNPGYTVIGRINYTFLTSDPDRVSFNKNTIVNRNYRNIVYGLPGTTFVLRIINHPFARRDIDFIFIHPKSRHKKWPVPNVVGGPGCAVVP